MAYLPMPESANKTRMGRPPLNVKPMVVRLGKRIPERIDGVLKEHESRASFIRKAVDEELRRREQVHGPLRKKPSVHKKK